MINHLEASLHFQLAGVEKTLLAMDTFLEANAKSDVKKFMETLDRSVLDFTQRLSSASLGKSSRRGLGLNSSQLSQQQLSSSLRLRQGSFSKGSSYVSSSNNNFSSNYNNNNNNNNYNHASQLLSSFSNNNNFSRLRGDKNYFSSSHRGPYYSLANTTQALEDDEIRELDDFADSGYYRSAADLDVDADGDVTAAGGSGGGSGSAGDDGYGARDGNERGENDIANANRTEDDNFDDNDFAASISRGKGGKYPSKNSSGSNSKKDRRRRSNENKNSRESDLNAGSSLSASARSNDNYDTRSGDIASNNNNINFRASSSSEDFTSYGLGNKFTSMKPKALHDKIKINTVTSAVGEGGDRSRDFDKFDDKFHKNMDGNEVEYDRNDDDDDDFNRSIGVGEEDEEEEVEGGNIDREHGVYSPDIYFADESNRDDELGMGMGGIGGDPAGVGDFWMGGGGRGVLFDPQGGSPNPTPTPAAAIDRDHIEGSGGNFTKTVDKDRSNLTIDALRVSPPKVKSSKNSVSFDPAVEAATSSSYYSSSYSSRLSRPSNSNSMRDSPDFKLASLSAELDLFESLGDIQPRQQSQYQSRSNQGGSSTSMSEVYKAVKSWGAETADKIRMPFVSSSSSSLSSSSTSNQNGKGSSQPTSSSSLTSSSIAGIPATSYLKSSEAQINNFNQGKVTNNNLNTSVNSSIGITNKSNLSKAVITNDDFDFDMEDGFELPP